MPGRLATAQALIAAAAVHREAIREERQRATQAALLEATQGRDQDRVELPPLDRRAES